MIDLSNGKDESFIVDFDIADDLIYILFADGREEACCYSEHNVNLYRYRMIEQVKKYSDSYLNYIAKESFMTYCKRVILIAFSIVSIYFAYNIDNELFMKIMSTLIVLIMNFGYYLFSEIKLDILSDEYIELESLIYYVKNLNCFNNDDKFLLPIEDVYKYNLTINDLDNIKKEIEDMKNNYGDDVIELSLSYTNKKPTL